MPNTNPTPTSRPIPDVSAMAARLREMAENLRDTASHVDAMANELLRFRDVEAVITQAQALAQYINTLGLTGAAAPTATPSADNARPDSRDPPAPSQQPEPETTARRETPTACPGSDVATPEPRRRQPAPRPKPEPSRPRTPAPIPEPRPDSTPEPAPELNVADDKNLVNQTLENMLPPDMRNASFGRRLSVTRAIRELSLADVAEATGIDEPLLRRLEQNQAAPTSDQLDKLSDVLDVSRYTLVIAPMTDLAPMGVATSTGARIRLVRIRAGLTQTALAKRLDVQNHVVDDYESDSGKKPNLEHLAVALNVDQNVFTAFLPNAPAADLSAFTPRPTPPSRPSASRDALANHPSTGHKLRSLRAERGWSLEELAGRAGISAQHLGSIENGAHNPRESTIQALARALRVAPLEIIGEPSMNTARVSTVRPDTETPRPEMKLDKRDPRPTKEASALRRARTIMNMSTKELAQASGVAESVIRDVESGRSVPTRDVIAALVAALPISEDDIYQNRV